jgi:hypothetical protein
VGPAVTEVQIRQHGGSAGHLAEGIKRHIEPGSADHPMAKGASTAVCEYDQGLQGMGQRPAKPGHGVHLVQTALVQMLSQSPICKWKWCYGLFHIHATLAEHLWYEGASNQVPQAQLVEVASGPAFRKHWQELSLIAVLVHDPGKKGEVGLSQQTTLIGWHSERKLNNWPTGPPHK